MSGLRIIEVNRIATLLMETWKRVDPNSGVAKFPASYVATFADMARAIVDDRSALEAETRKDERSVIIAWLRSADTPVDISLSGGDAATQALRDLDLADVIEAAAIRDLREGD